MSVYYLCKIFGWFFPDLNLAVRKDWSKGMIYARVVI